MKYLGFPRLRMTSQETMPIANFEHAANPTATVNPPFTPVTWLNTTTGNVFVCIDNTANANVWINCAGRTVIDYENPIEINTATTLTISSHHVISDLSTPADYTVTLPAASGNAGKQISLQMSPTLTKIVTVDGNASEEIDGETSRAMWAGECATLLCDGIGWTKIAGKSIPMKFSVYMSSSEGNKTPGAYSIINYDTEIYDHGGVFASSTLTARRTNQWQLTGVVESSPTGADSSRFVCKIFRDQTDNDFLYNLQFVFAAGVTVGVCVAWDGIVTTGEDIDLRIYMAMASGTFSITGAASAGSRNKLSGTEILDW